MDKTAEDVVQCSDYSLVGRDTTLAIQKGLADANWYTSPVPRETMRQLLERRDGPAIRDTLLWFALLFLFGYLGYALWGTWWAVIPFAIYGVLYASVSDSRWHESSHGTAFKSDWMNNALYEVASFMVLRESVPWRWSHTRHHSDTIIVGRDPVAVDSVGLEIIKAKRKSHFGQEITLSTNPKHIRQAEVKHKLGVSNINQIELIKLGWKEDILI